MKPVFSIETLWQAIHFKPNSEQEEAIQHLSGPLYLPAGPGSGKTPGLGGADIKPDCFHNINLDEIFLSTLYREGGTQLQAAIDIQKNILELGKPN
jgi:hypothetical protein